jgi:hypothetical protein
MDQDGDPTQHPQTGGLLRITDVDPGEERYQNAGNGKNNKFFKPRGHVGFAASILAFLAGIKNRQRKAVAEKSK